MSLSPKQRKVLEVIASYRTGVWPTIDELIHVMGAASSKQAMQHTLRELEAKEYVIRRYERRAERVNLVLEATSTGLRVADGLAP